MNSSSHPRLNPLSHIQVPEFDEYLLSPNNTTCKIINTNRILMEVLGGAEQAPSELGNSQFGDKVLIEGRYGLLLRYRREKNNMYHPACVLSFDANEKGIHIKQIQGSSDRNIAYRFHSSFDTSGFFADVIQRSFVNKNIPVHVEQFPTGIEDASYNSKAMERYSRFHQCILGIIARKR